METQAPDTEAKAKLAADGLEMDARTFDVFHKYCAERFPQSEDSYWKEWAGRFANRWAWGASDVTGQAILTRMVGPSAHSF